ncbi:gustatory and pheromone receptor 32a-like [Schistocerca cancellata]|uniref:gustatory and pheromone receptor 32a-like n=1 Tax=Schistocerca cancellata TaxID=274614 RepID=UPI002117349A|nr:gustatory and pheromone receptor 32a-like [Schistocerca cancellata]
MAHLSLHRATELLQAHTGAAALLEVAGTFCGAVYSGYELVLLLLLRPSNVENVLLNRSSTLAAVWLVLHTVRLAGLSLSCGLAAGEARRTQVVLARAAALLAPAAAPLELRAFQQQLAALPAQPFTAAGFLTIDRGLFTSAIATAVSYLIIIGQMIEK